jgi:outer membrane lipoprotein-sorting protein
MVRQIASFPLVLALALFVTPAAGAQPAAAQSRQAPIGPPPGDLNPRPGEHPLAPLIRWGKAGIKALAQLDDYSCKLVKRERVGGKLGNHQWMSVKVRQQPFSVYAAFVRNKERPWQEVIFEAGANGDKMFVHSDEYRLMGTVSMFPDSDRAMRENRYPITEVGILHLIERLVEHAENDARFDDCEVKVYKDAKIESRPCLYIRVTHNKRRPEFSFHMARIFIDNELNVPVRYEAYTWPDTPDAKPALMEEYTYLDFQFNQDFTDRDFDINNPGYFFPPDFGDPDVDILDVKPVVRLPADSGFAQAPASSPPLAGCIAMARDALGRLDKVADYQCLLSHREQQGPEPGKYENLLLKVRHKPSDLYAFFLGPRTPKGEEAIFHGGGQQDKVLMHTVGTRRQQAVNRQLAQDDPELVRSAGAPLAELGLRSQLARWLSTYESELARGECTVRYYPQIEVDHRTATCVEVVHPTERPQFRFQRSRLYFDEESKLPVRFEAYGWPAAAGGEGPLAVEFTYRNVELNRGFTDEDFSPANPNYAFSRQPIAARAGR